MALLYALHTQGRTLFRHYKTQMVKLLAEVRLIGVWFDIFLGLVGKKSPTLGIPGVLKVVTLVPSSVKLYFKMVSSKDASSMTKV